MDPDERFADSVKVDVERFLAFRGLPARVLMKKNRDGDMVIGIILPRELPY